MNYPKLDTEEWGLSESSFPSTATKTSCNLPTQETKTSLNIATRVY